MLTLEQCKEHLIEEGIPFHSDEDILAMRDDMYVMAEIGIEEMIREYTCSVIAPEGGNDGVGDPTQSSVEESISALS